MRKLMRKKMSEVKRADINHHSFRAEYSIDTPREKDDNSSSGPRTHGSLRMPRRLFSAHLQQWLEGLQGRRRGGCGGGGVMAFAESPELARLVDEAFAEHSDLLSATLPQDKKPQNKKSLTKTPPDTDKKPTVLPLQQIARIMRKHLPPTSKISRDAVLLMREAATEYACFIAAEARDISCADARRSITAKDMIMSMKKLGFDEDALIMHCWMLKRGLAGAYDPDLSPTLTASPPLTLTTSPPLTAAPFASCHSSSWAAPPFAPWHSSSSAMAPFAPCHSASLVATPFAPSLQSPQDLLPVHPSDNMSHRAAYVPSSFPVPTPNVPNPAFGISMPMPSRMAETTEETEPGRHHLHPYKRRNCGIQLPKSF